MALPATDAHLGLGGGGCGEEVGVGAASHAEHAADLLGAEVGAGPVHLREGNLCWVMQGHHAVATCLGAPGTLLRSYAPHLPVLDQRDAQFRPVAARQRPHRDAIHGKVPHRAGLPSAGVWRVAQPIGQHIHVAAAPLPLRAGATGLQQPARMLNRGFQLAAKCMSIQQSPAVGQGRAGLTGVRLAGLIRALLQRLGRACARRKKACVVPAVHVSLPFSGRSRPL
jgi:hypothetical protein